MRLDPNSIAAGFCQLNVSGKAPPLWKTTPRKRPLSLPGNGAALTVSDLKVTLMNFEKPRDSPTSMA